MTPQLRKLFFETLYKNRYLYRFRQYGTFRGPMAHLAGIGSFSYSWT